MAVDHEESFDQIEISLLNKQRSNDVEEVEYPPDENHNWTPTHLVTAASLARWCDTKPAREPIPHC